MFQPMLGLPYTVLWPSDDAGFALHRPMALHFFRSWTQDIFLSNVLSLDNVMIHYEQSLFNRCASILVSNFAHSVCVEQLLS